MPPNINRSLKCLGFWDQLVFFPLKRLFEEFFIGARWNFSKFRPTPTKIEKNFYWFILCFRQFGAFYNFFNFFLKKVRNFQPAGPPPPLPPPLSQKFLTFFGFCICASPLTSLQLKIKTFFQPGTCFINFLWKCEYGEWTRKGFQRCCSQISCQ